MGWTPTFTADRFSSQQNLLNGIDSRRLFNADGKIHQLDARQAPILAMLFSKLPQVGVSDPDFQFYEERPYWTDKYKGYVDTFSDGGGSAVFTIGVGDVNTDGAVSGSLGFLKVGQTFRIIDSDGTEMICEITTVTNSTSIVAKRLSSSTLFTPAEGDEIKFVGNAHVEGGLKTTNVSHITDVRWGSTQIFKNLISMSRTLMKTALKGGESEWDRQKAIALKVLWSDVERSLIFGERQNVFAAPATYNNTTPTTRYTMGIRQACNWANTSGFGNTTVFNVDMASYSYGDLIDDMEQAFYFGNDSKIAICGNGVISYFNKLALQESQLNINMRESEFGFKIYEIITAHGMIKLIKHPFLTGSDAYKMFMLDMDNLGLEMFDNLTLEEKVQTNGKDSREDQWLIDVGLKVKLPETHSYWTFS